MIDQVKSKLTEAVGPQHLEVHNESHLHKGSNHPFSHLNIVMVSSQFATKSRVQRHRFINEILADELADFIHALSLKLFTPEEWQAATGKDLRSPPCRLS